MTRFGRLAPLLATAALALGAIAPARAAVFVVTKTIDTADGDCDADCSLREAVVAANAHAGEDVILLGAELYVLTLAGSEDAAAAGDLDVLDDLVVLGEGADSTAVDGGAIDRLVQVAGGVTLELRDLTLLRGRSVGNGGAIRNQGKLVVLRSVLISSAATGGGSGGAIHSDGPGASLSLRDSTLHNNVADGRGGGVMAGETVELANVTISDNSAEVGLGGGVYILADSSTTIRNATIAGNRAGDGGGIYVESSAFPGPAPKVTNSVVALNFAAVRPDCTGVIDTSHSLFGDATGCIRPAGSNDLVGSASSPLDPRLDFLQQDGGPTPTRPLLAGSPALEAGNPATPGSGGNACEATDQRGAARPAGTACDLGAFEQTAECVAGGSVLCLEAGRFRVTAFWRTGAGSFGFARGHTLSADSGYFTFFGRDNVEVTLKVLNGCGVNGRHWVFAAGMTNVQVDLAVRDTLTGSISTYGNPQGRRFRTILDTSAFGCP
jgi:CSLREA domain-containing protein